MHTYIITYIYTYIIIIYILYIIYISGRTWAGDDLIEDCAHCSSLRPHTLVA